VAVLVVAQYKVVIVVPAHLDKEIAAERRQLPAAMVVVAVAVLDLSVLLELLQRAARAARD
jgi:hypothetical protein